MISLVGNGTVLTRDQAKTVIPGGCLVIEDNLIKETGLTAEMKAKYPKSVFIDAKGGLIMPGMINTHMHLYSTFARGMALKDAPPENFRQILERLWWRLDKALTMEDIFYSALVPMIDCIKNGTTTIFDHHASPRAVRGSLFKMAEAARLLGLRAAFCYEVSDRDGLSTADAGIEENREFITECAEKNGGMVSAMFGLHASFTLSDQTLVKCAAANSGSKAGFHIHAAEGIADVEETLAMSGKRVIPRLADFGILGPRTIAAHCVHIMEKEIGILAESGTFVVHNPESNMGNAVGAAPVLGMVKSGVRLGLGTDGYTADMFESFKAANLLQKFAAGDPSAAWAEVPAAIFDANPEFAGVYFPGKLGRLTPGSYADVIISDYQPPTPLDKENQDGHLLFGVSGRSVVTTIINGRIVMQNRELAEIDEEAILAKSRELAQKTWQRF